MLQLRRSLSVFAGLSVICGLIYPLAITVISQTVFPDNSNARIIKKGEQIIGSPLIGQQFTSSKYFHGRPSVTDPPYAASNSGGSNLGPTSAKLLAQVQARVRRVRRENGLPFTAPVPADLVLASASGLDPHISPLAAALQVKRVAGERKIPEADIEKIIHRKTEYPLLGIWGGARVNVLELNLALDGIKTQR